MSKRTFPADVREQARGILDAWKNIDPALTLGQVTQESMEADLSQALALQTQLNQAEDQLTNLRNQRDDLHAGLWDQAKRVRAGIKAIYGDDSSEYERVGGTRMSERARVHRAVGEEKAAA